MPVPELVGLPRQARGVRGLHWWWRAAFEFNLFEREFKGRETNENSFLACASAAGPVKEGAVIMPLADRAAALTIHLFAA